MESSSSSPSSVESTLEESVGKNELNLDAFVLNLQLAKFVFSYFAKFGTNLQVLRLSRSGLKYISPDIKYLTSLRVLWASKNQIVHLPKEIGQCTRLEKIILQDNQLVGLPESIGNLKNLRVLWLERNNIKTLPASLEQCTKLVGHSSFFFNFDCSENPISIPQICCKRGAPFTIRWLSAHSKSCIGADIGKYIEPTETNSPSQVGDDTDGESSQQSTQDSEGLGDTSNPLLALKSSFAAGTTYLTFLSQANELVLLSKKLSNLVNLDINVPKLTKNNDKIDQALVLVRSLIDDMQEEE